MDGMNPFSTDQWIQQYSNSDLTQSGGEPSEDTIITVQRNSIQGNTGQVGPKPIRSRRSRASRRTPTTVLNASPNDFRALVQRFTGCDNMPSASMVSVVSLPKGPVNIDFARNDVNETSSSRYAYFNNQAERTPLHAEQMQSVGGLTDLQAGYGRENDSVVYEPIDESLLMATRKDGGSHGYN